MSLTLPLAPHNFRIFKFVTTTGTDAGTRRLCIKCITQTPKLLQGARQGITSQELWAFRWGDAFFWDSDLSHACFRMTCVKSACSHGLEIGIMGYRMLCILVHRISIPHERPHATNTAYGHEANVRRSISTHI